MNNIKCISDIEVKSALDRKTTMGNHQRKCGETLRWLDNNNNWRCCKCNAKRKAPPREKYVYEPQVDGEFWVMGKPP